MKKGTGRMLIVLLLIAFVIGLFVSVVYVQTSRDVIYYASGEDDTIQGQAMKIQQDRANPLSFALVALLMLFSFGCGMAFVMWQQYKTAMKKARAARARARTQALKISAARDREVRNADQGQYRPALATGNPINEARE